MAVAFCPIAIFGRYNSSTGTLRYRALFNESSCSIPVRGIDSEKAPGFTVEIVSRLFAGNLHPIGRDKTKNAAAAKIPSTTNISFFINEVLLPPCPQKRAANRDEFVGHSCEINGDGLALVRY